MVTYAEKKIRQQRIGIDCGGSWGLGDGRAVAVRLGTSGRRRLGQYDCQGPGLRDKLGGYSGGLWLRAFRGHRRKGAETDQREAFCRNQMRTALEREETNAQLSRS